MKNLIDKSTKHTLYSIKNLYVGEIVSFYAKKYKDSKFVDLTTRAKKSAILTQVNPKTLTFQYIKTNKIIKPVELTSVGQFALNDKTVTPLKDFCPELLKELKLTENSKLSKSKILKHEDYLNKNLIYNSVDLKL